MTLKQSEGAEENRPGRLPEYVGAPRVSEALGSMVTTAVHALGYDAVAVNLRRRDGAFEVVADAGSGGDILGSTTPRAMWADLLREEYRVSNSYLIPPEHTQRILGAYPDVATVVPDAPEAAGADTWDRENMLLVPLLGYNREMIGVFSVDSPRNGKLPDEESIRDLETVAGHTALAIENSAMLARMEAEIKALHRSERRFRSLIQNTSDILVILDASGTICYESPAVERILGYSPGERLGRTCFELIHTEDVVPAQATFAESVRSPGRTVSLECRLQHRDGSWRYVEVAGTNLLHDTSVGGIAVNIRDVTGRKQAEAALRESEARFRAIFETTSIGIALTDQTGRLVETNLALQQMLGYGEEELQGMMIKDITHPEDIAPNMELLQELLAGRRDRYRMEKRYIHRDGQVVWGCLTV